MSWFLRNLRFHAVEDGVELLRDEYGDNPHLTLLAREIGHLLALDQETTGSPGRVYGVGVPGTVGRRGVCAGVVLRGEPRVGGWRLTGFAAICEGVDDCAMGGKLGPEGVSLGRVRNMGRPLRQTVRRVLQ